ncbi:MAG: hypothetical protein ACKOQ4_06540 [Mycobacterium sp.]
MSEAGHPELGPELRQLARAILERLDPAVRAAATMATEALRGPGRCQQVWCPVCALAALASGEQHPLLGVIAEHSVALMSVVRTMAADPQGRAEDSRPAEDPLPEPSGEAAPRSSNGSYHHIPIVIETVGADD